MPDVIAANREKLLSGVLAGLVATLLMTGLLLVAPALAPNAPEAAAGAGTVLRAHPLWALALLALHLTYGSLAGGLFAVGARAITVRRGVVFAGGLWGVAFAVYAPLLGLGFLSSQEPALAALAIPAHLLYGIALGGLAPRSETRSTAAWCGGDSVGR